jgi:hypothetical protein
LLYELQKRISNISNRKWATIMLKQNINKGYTINERILNQNKTEFINALDNLTILAQDNRNLEVTEILSLTRSFSTTFFALNHYEVV